ncbi:MAG TPA: hypothetical protein PKL42_01665, partial [Methylotenera sp.]|nr:hypothetical protein [Methylotenera sp.]
MRSIFNVAGMKSTLQHFSPTTMNSQIAVIGRLFFQSIFLLAFLLTCPTTQAAELQYQVEIIVTAENANGQVAAIKSLL